LEHGREYERAVALRLLDEGFAVRIGTLERAETPWERERFREETDVIVSDRIPIEVKSNRRTFTSPEDLPFPMTNVCTVRRWDERQIKPWAFVLVSQLTGAMVALSVARTIDKWVVAESHDQRRDGWMTPTYRVPREQFVAFDVLVAALHQLLGEQ
jgi:hypothetical protein